MADKEPKPKKEKVAKVAKVKLTADERRAAVRDKREAKVSAAFKGHKWDLIEEVSDRPYTDVTGNKGKHGFLIKCRTAPANSEFKEGAEIVVGPTALKKAIEVYKAIAPLPKKERQARTKETAEAKA